MARNSHYIETEPTMDGWMAIKMDGWMDKWMNEWMNYNMRWQPCNSMRDTLAHPHISYWLNASSRKLVWVTEKKNSFSTATPNMLDF